MKPAQIAKLVTKTPINESPQGVSARWVSFGNGWGIKLFTWEEDRENTIRNQSPAVEAGLAPRMGGTLDIGNEYGLIMEEVETYECRILQVKKRLYYKSEDCELFDFCVDGNNFTEHFPNYEEIHERLTQQIESLREDLKTIGFDFLDDHWGNVGINSDGKMVCIDFGEM